MDYSQLAIPASPLPVLLDLATRAPRPLEHVVDIIVHWFVNGKGAVLLTLKGLAEGPSFGSVSLM
jgi:hypothetical protein